MDTPKTASPPRIAIPLPKSGDDGYVSRSLPQYEAAVRAAGGAPVRIPLDRTPAEAMQVIERCDAVLLPGSGADVDPAKYEAQRGPHTANPDPRRDTIDELLLQDAYNMHKPVLAICYGLQSLNVYRSGTLVQHVPDWLPPEKRTLVNHEAGRNVAVAHSVEIESDSTLAKIVDSGASPTPRVIAVNSSHHQAVEVVGDELRVVARCVEDGVIEGLEGTAPDHFVLAVQWHPERGAETDPPSQALFRLFVEAARAKHGQLKGEFEAV